MIAEEIVVKMHERVPQYYDRIFNTVEACQMAYDLARTEDLFLDWPELLQTADQIARERYEGAEIH